MQTGTMRLRELTVRYSLIALIDQAPVIEKILSHLGLPSEIPKPALARAPPPEQADSAALDFGA
jgi:hypothetical protein